MCNVKVEKVNRKCNQASIASPLIYVCTKVKKEIGIKKTAYLVNSLLFKASFGNGIG